VLRTFLLFVLTAIAEIVGCYLPHLVLKGGRTPLLLIPLMGVLMAQAGMGVLMGGRRGF
jgi:small multidrug resistance family-3 protein